MDYIIDNKNVIYNFDSFCAFKDIKTDEITTELLDKQEGLGLHFVSIKNNVADETNNFYQQLNIKLNPYKLETKGIYAFNPSIHQNEFDKRRYQINNMVDLKNISLVSLMNMFSSIDGYFESNDFKNNFFKRFNSKENSIVSYEYHKLVGQTKIKSLPYAIKMKLKFNKKMSVPNVNTHIIIKDTKSNKTKEYKYMSLVKLEKILTKHTVIQPTITLKLIYFNIDTEIDVNNIEHINIKYGVSIEVSNLIVYTDNFNKTIFNDLGDYYDNFRMISSNNNKILIVMVIFYIIMFISILYKKVNI